MDNPRVGIYVRVSSREQAQEGYSIPAQKRRLELYCDSMDWKERTFYEDPGYSAKDTDRPAFQQLKKDIESGKIDILLVYRLDRMTRSVRDLFDILNYLEAHKCAFKSSSENYDTSTAMGRMFIGLVGLLAQWERENLGERVSMGMREKVVSKTEASGQQPFGYRIEGKKRVVDEKEKEIVLLMIDLFKKLNSASAVAKDLNRMNIPTRTKKAIWSHQTIRQIFRNPSLYGAALYDGELIEDVSEGIITKTEFVSLNERLGKQNLVRIKGPTRGLFSGMLICPVCQSTLVKTENRYRCNKCQESDRGTMRVNENQIMDALKKYISDLEIDPVKVEVNRKPKRDIAKEINRVEARRMKYQRMYADDLMTYDELQQHMEDSKVELNQLEVEQIDDEQEELSPKELDRFKWMFRENIEVMTTEEQIDFMMMFIKRIEFERECVKYDKNGVPNAYEYRVTGVELNRL